MSRANLALGIIAVAALAWSVNAVAIPHDLKPVTLLGAQSNKERARGFVQTLDASSFNGFFASNGTIDHSDIMAMFQVESRFNPEAVNLNDGGANNHAYGIGQMLASTAADIGIADPNTLLNMQTGVNATLTYMVWIFEFLTPRLGRAPTRSEWIGAYNAGVGNVLLGNIPLTYMAKVNAAKIFI